MKQRKRKADNDRNPGEKKKIASNIYFQFLIISVYKYLYTILLPVNLNQLLQRKNGKKKNYYIIYCAAPPSGLFWVLQVQKILLKTSFKTRKTSLLFAHYYSNLISFVFMRNILFALPHHCFAIFR